MIAHEPIHPGEILNDEFLEPLGITQYRLAKTIGVPARRINEIIHGQRRITPDTALRLSKALGLSERYWMNMQAEYDMQVEKLHRGAEFSQIPVIVQDHQLVNA